MHPADEAFALYLLRPDPEDGPSRMVAWKGARGDFLAGWDAHAAQVREILYTEDAIIERVIAALQKLVSE